MVTHLKFVIAKLEHHRYAPSSERSRKLLDQAELQLEEFEADAAEEVVATEVNADQGESVVRSFTRRKPVRGPLPAHLPRERVVIPAQPPALAVAWRFQAGRDHHREPGEHSASEEGDPDGAREIRVPCLRDNHPAACAIPSDRPWPRGSKPAGDILVPIRQSPAAQSPKRDIFPRGN